MRSPSILTSLSSALVVTLLSPLALAQVPGQAPSAAPAPGAPSPYPAQPAPPWPGQVPGAQPAPGAYPGAPGQIPGYPPPGATQPAPGAYGPQPAPGAYGAQPAPGQPAPGQPLGATPAPGTPFGATGAVSLDSSQGVAASADVNAPSEETQEIEIAPCKSKTRSTAAPVFSGRYPRAPVRRTPSASIFSPTGSRRVRSSATTPTPVGSPGSGPDPSSDSATHFGANVGLSSYAAPVPRGLRHHPVDLQLRQIAAARSSCRCSAIRRWASKPSPPTRSASSSTSAARSTCSC